MWDPDGREQDRTHRAGAPQTGPPNQTSDPKGQNQAKKASGEQEQRHKYSRKNRGIEINTQGKRARCQDLAEGKSNHEGARKRAGVKSWGGQAIERKKVGCKKGVRVKRRRTENDTNGERGQRGKKKNQGRRSKGPYQKNNKMILYGLKRSKERTILSD